VADEHPRAAGQRTSTSRGADGAAAGSGVAGLRDAGWSAGPLRVAHARGLVLRVQARRAGGPRAPAEARRGPLPGDRRRDREVHPRAAPGGPAAQRPRAHACGEAAQTRGRRQAGQVKRGPSAARARAVAAAAGDAGARASGLHGGAPGRPVDGRRDARPAGDRLVRRAAQEGVHAVADRRRLALRHQQRLPRPRGRRAPGGRLSPGDHRARHPTRVLRRRWRCLHRALAGDDLRRARYPPAPRPQGGRGCEGLRLTLHLFRFSRRDVAFPQNS
jgi:hypothetical protein